MDVKLDKWHRRKIDKEILKELSKKEDMKPQNSNLKKNYFHNFELD